MILKGKELDNNKTYIMAILNLTPDSFYDGGRLFFNDNVDVDKVLKKVEELINDGADIIDIGAQSTRPGYSEVGFDEELRRLLPALRKIRENFDIPISIDTYMPEVARTVINEDVDIINDIGFLSDEMLTVITDSSVNYCLVHNRNVKVNRDEESITIDEVNNELHNKINRLREYGVDDSRIIIDPGIGFGKSNKDDIMILRNIDSIKIHNLPILVGASNKSCIEYICKTDISDRLEGTLAITARAFFAGASFIRVHDVRSNKMFLRMLSEVDYDNRY